MFFLTSNESRVTEILNDEAYSREPLSRSRILDFESTIMPLAFQLNDEVMKSLTRFLNSYIQQYYQDPLALDYVCLALKLNANANTATRSKFNIFHKFHEHEASLAMLLASMAGMEISTENKFHSDLNIEDTINLCRETYDLRCVVNKYYYERNYEEGIELMEALIQNCQQLTEIETLHGDDSNIYLSCSDVYGHIIQKALLMIQEFESEYSPETRGVSVVLS